MSNDERFWSKVDKSGECWIWSSATNQGGYGVFWKDRRSQLAHRIAYELTNGPIPEGMFLDHKCHNRACVNPGHLRVVTRKQNNENQGGANANNPTGYRGVSRNRNRWMACVKHGGRSIFVGTFATAEEAAEAAKVRRLELFTHNDADRT